MNIANTGNAKTVGQVVYEEFCRQHGLPFKQWSNLSAPVRVNWEAAAKAGVDFIAI